MDSPKREWAPSSELQGSPLFKFLCSLSPIKPARSVHVAQTYSELSFPPPPPVFASPKNQRFEKGNKSEDPGGRAFGEEENCWTSSAKYTLDSSICQVSGGHEVITRSLRPCEQTPPASHERDESVQITCASNTVCQNDDTSQVVEDGENQAGSENDFYFSNKLQLAELPNFPSEDGKFSEPSAMSAESLCDFSKVESLDFHKPQHNSPCVTKLANDTLIERIQDGGKSFKGNVTNRGPRRRCLDFETNEFQGINNSSPMQDSASHPLGTGSAINSMKNLDGVTTISTSTSASSKSEFVSEERGTLSGVTLHSNFQMTKLSESSRRLKNPGVSPTISSSIGLHLNSLSGTAGLTSNAKDCIPAYVPSRSGRSCEAQAGAEPNKVCANYGPGLLVSMVEKSQTDEELRGNPRIIKSTTRFRSVTLGIQSFEACLPCSVERSASPVGRKRLQLLQESSSQENSELQEKVRTPRKKRKSLSDGDGCKHCNCKKSKCLKLYCECFAAGVYCVDSCACHGCFNKPEYAETVLETRKQVESRNPLAFAPKIVQASESSPTNKDPCTDMSASARHKRGCNCKKSHCLKRYCECYQAGVGCSEGCRCNGCKNMFGKKKASEDAEEQESYADADPDTLELLPETNRILDGSQPYDTKLNQSVPRTVSPITPTPDHSLLASSASWSACNGDGRNESTRRTYVVQWVHSTNVDEKNQQELKPLDNKNVGVEQQAPQWNELSELCTITPAAQHPLRPPPSFSTTGKTCSLLLSSGDMEHLSTELKYGRMASPFDMSSVFDTKDSLATEHLSTSQGKSDVIGTASEDDSMPEMLREGQSTSNGSPKQKRVTPPRPDGLRRITSPVTRSSPRLLAGRKICLQALPSLPPVTPYGSVYGQGASGKQN